MTAKHIPPRWIKAYDGGARFWPLVWDQGVLRRVLLSPHICHRFQMLLEECGADVAQEVLEACLSVRGQWESAPKVPQHEQEKAIKKLRGLTSELIKAIEDNEDALRANRAMPLSLPMLFPERPDLWGTDDDETPPIRLDEALIRFQSSLCARAPWEGELLYPAKPNHPNAFRTFVAQNLIDLFRTKTGKPRYSVVADLVNLVVNDPRQTIDPTHVIKLDPDSHAP